LRDKISNKSCESSLYLVSFDLAVAEADKAAGIIHNHLVMGRKNKGGAFGFIEGQHQFENLAKKFYTRHRFPSQTQSLNPLDY